MIRIGVIGLGFGRHVHIPALKLIPQAQLVAVSARTAQSAEAVAASEKVQAFTDPLELIASPDVDAVILAVPPNAQPDLIRQCIQKKKHVFLEKPVGGGTAEAMKLYQEMQRSSLIHMIDFEFCDLPAWKSFATELPSLGELRQVNVSWNSETVSQKNYALQKTNSWKIDLTQGGGTLNNLGSHALYYLEHFFGPMKSLLCSLESGSWPTDSTMRMLVEWPKFVGQVVIATNCPGGNGHRIEVHGSEASLQLDNSTADYMSDFRLTKTTRGSIRTDLTPPEPPSTHKDGRVQAVHRLLTRWIEGIKNNTQVSPNLAHGARVEHLIDQCRLSHQSRSWQAQ
ncbi:MAG: Gfo/Idh/MocA family protein [Bdellovibrionales bacterium]